MNKTIPTKYVESFLSGERNSFDGFVSVDSHSSSLKTLDEVFEPWCSYCRRIGPAYEKIGEEYADSLAVGKINIDEEPRLAGAEGIEDIPTLVLYRNGKAVDSIIAPGSKAEIDRFIQEALAK